MAQQARGENFYKTPSNPPSVQLRKGNSIRCFVGGEYAPRDAFSARQLQKFDRQREHPDRASISCREHTTQQRHELQCEGHCARWLPLESFSQSTRKHGSKWCHDCTEWLLSVEPGYTPLNPPNGDNESDEEMDLIGAVADAMLPEAPELPPKEQPEMDEWLETSVVNPLINRAPPGPHDGYDGLGRLMPPGATGLGSLMDSMVPMHSAQPLALYTPNPNSYASKVAGASANKMLPGLAASSESNEGSFPVMMPQVTSSSALVPPQTTSSTPMSHHGPPAGAPTGMPSNDHGVPYRNRPAPPPHPTAERNRGRYPSGTTEWMENQFSALALAKPSEPVGRTPSRWAKPNQRRTDMLTPKYVALSGGQNPLPQSIRRSTYADMDDDSGDEC